MKSLLGSLAAALAVLTATPVPAATRAADAPPPAPPITILISIDGFRADYLYRAVTPNITALAAEGVQATAMRPSYPSLTFPNHYAMVTGLRPDHSGMVDNVMEDVRQPGVVFSVAKPATLYDPFWWNAAEPLWVTAERNGVRTAAMLWPGSDLPIRGVQPHDWKLYEKKLPADQRVAQVLAWLKRPAEQRPRFVALYFEEVDTFGHDVGPDAPELTGALTRTDAAVGRLVAGLKALKLYGRTNLVLVSDHGMAPTAPERVVNLDKLLPAGSFRAVTVGSSAGVVPAEGHQAQVEKVLLAKRPHMTCWRKGEIPARLHYGTNPRIPPIVCLGETGWVVSTQAGLKAHPVKKGAHGYDPDDPLMAALFVAEGPAFRKGVIQPAFDNVDVYPLLAKLIGIALRPNDGNLADLLPSLNP